MDIEQAFGLVLKRQRNDKGFSQEELAKESGYHRTYISLLERGKKSPSLSTVYRLADALDAKSHLLILLAEQMMEAADEDSRDRSSDQ